ncbi:nuclear protein [Cryptococcus neoformans Tu259-1]|nr:nuclear protein [Cryptococcus neoformans var. grubii Tu259-1]
MQSTVDNRRPDHHIFRGESPTVSYPSRAKANAAPQPNSQINGPEPPEIAVVSRAEKPVDESGSELPFASSLISNSISQPAFEARRQTGYDDTVFTLPDGLISYWPLDADQQRKQRETYSGRSSPGTGRERFLGHPERVCDRETTISNGQERFLLGYPQRGR